MQTDPDSEIIKDLVRKTLQQLYNPLELRRSQLIELLGIPDRGDRVASLRKVFQDAITALKPTEKTAPESSAWRTYEILSYRYLEQMSQKEVAADLSISIRQLQRLEAAAVDAIADALLEKFKRTNKTSGEGIFQSPSVQPDISDNESQLPGVNQELEWIRKSYANEEIVFQDILKAVLSTLMPVIERDGIVLLQEIPADLPLIFANSTTLKQAFLNLLSAVFEKIPRGKVRLTARSESKEIVIDIKGYSSDLPGTATDDLSQGQMMQLSQELFRLCGGEVVVQPNLECEAGFCLTIRVQEVRKIPVIVLDDNADTLRLLERYLSGTQYTFFGVQDPSQIFQVIHEVLPSVIVLDVMLPGIDGWELLGRLKAHPDSQNAAILISTIMPQKSLALMLGADGFLKKPFTQEEFLAAIASQKTRMDPE